MKILIIDDTQANLKSARITLANHELTLCESAHNALEILEAFKPKKSRGQSPFYWDVVLIDLMMAPSTRVLSPEAALQFANQEQPVGFGLALLAAMRGAKYVAVASATNHHDHPCAAMLDFLEGVEYKDGRDCVPRPQFVINSARMGMYHAPMKMLVSPEVPCAWCPTAPRENCGRCTGKGTHLEFAKDWGAILDALLAGD